MPVTLSDNLAEILIGLLLVNSAPSLDLLAISQENNALLKDIQGRLIEMSATNTTVNAQVDTELQGIQRDMQAQTTVTQSVITLVTGMAAQLQTALASATDAGATVEQLAGIKAFHTSLVANTAALASMVTANTVATSEPDAVPVDTAPKPVTGGDTPAPAPIPPVEVPPVGGSDAGVQGSTQGSAVIGE